MGEFMDIRYKRNHNKSYMLINSEVPRNVFEEKMIKQNRVASVIDFYSMEIENQLVYWYNITGKESLKDYLDTKGLSLEILEKLLMHFHLSCEEISKYLISQEHFLVGIDTIYVDRSTKKDAICLCYTPEECDTITHQFRSVLEYILTILDHSDEELTKVCYELYDIASKDDYSIMELLDRVNEAYCDTTMPYVEKIELSEYSEEDKSDETVISKKRESEILKNREYEIRQKQIDDLYEIDNDDTYSYTNERIGFEIPERKSFFKRLFGAKKKNKVDNSDQSIRRKEYMDFEFDPEEEICKPTVLLSGANDGKSICAGKLMYDGIGQEDNYLIDKDAFSIGTNKNKNDAILNSKAVSRNHARITRKGTQYFIEDLNSTNGTFVNERPIDYRQLVPLNSMDKIRFADVKYVFM